MSDYTKDKEIIEAATPGPWEDDEDPSLVVSSDKQGTICDAYWPPNQKFIKYFNPSYVSELVQKAQRCGELEVMITMLASELKEATNALADEWPEESEYAYELIEQAEELLK